MRLVPRTPAEKAISKDTVREPGAPERFDATYYQTFYGRTPVHTRRDIAHLASAVVSMAAWWKIPIRSVLDVGAGPGYWRDWFVAHRPRVRYHSTDVSEYACRKYRHDLRDITTWTPDTPADLVVCQGVLHYLDDAGAESAISNLTKATHSLLYLEAPTSEDRDDVLDTDVSDLHAVWRSAKWYRDRLADGFVQAGAGLWVRRGALYLYALESLPSSVTETVDTRQPKRSPRREGTE